MFELVQLVTLTVSSMIKQVLNPFFATTWPLFHHVAEVFKAKEINHIDMVPNLRP